MAGTLVVAVEYVCHRFFALRLAGCASRRCLAVPLPFACISIRSRAIFSRCCGTFFCAGRRTRSVLSSRLICDRGDRDISLRLFRLSVASYRLWREIGFGGKLPNSSCIFSSASAMRALASRADTSFLLSPLSGSGGVSPMRRLFLRLSLRRARVLPRRSMVAACAVMHRDDVVSWMCRVRLCRNDLSTASSNGLLSKLCRILSFILP